MRKSLCLVLAALLALALLAGCSQGGSGKIRIGGAFNLTGAQASLDNPSSNGAKLAVKEINAAGGIGGKELELIVVDTKTDPATAANVATQMVEQQKVQAMLGYADSDFVLAAGPVAQKAGIPFVVIGATSPRLPGQVGDKVFLVPFGDNVQAAAAAEYAVKDLGARSAWVLTDQGMEFTKLLAAYFKESFVGLGGQVVAEDTYVTGDTDFSAQVTKLKGLPSIPDILFVSSGPNEAGTIVKQIRDAGVTAPVVSGDGFDTPLLVEVAGAQADGVYFATHSFVSPQGTELVQKFYAAYEQEYGRPPENAFAALGYDAIYLLADAMRRAGGSDPAQVAEALAKTQSLMAVTGAITYPDGSQVPQKGVTIIKVMGGQWGLGAEMVPAQVPAP